MSKKNRKKNNKYQRRQAEILKANLSNNTVKPTIDSKQEKTQTTSLESNLPIKRIKKDVYKTLAYTLMSILFILAIHKSGIDSSQIILEIKTILKI